MEQNRQRACGMMAFVAICCAVMAYVEVAIKPAYMVKSAIKVLVFLVLPLVTAKAAGIKPPEGAFGLDRRGLAKRLLLGLLIYGVIMAAYALTTGVFDYTRLVQSLSADQKVDSGSFIWVALYISFCNSFLEEFLFRFVSFLQLSRYTAKKTAYGFSSVMFAVYHIAMLGASFPPLLLVLAVAGLAIGGLIFDYVDDKSGSLYNSWVVHMFADFAIITIWYLHI